MSARTPDSSSTRPHGRAGHAGADLRRLLDGCAVTIGDQVWHLRVAGRRHPTDTPVEIHLCMEGPHRRWRHGVVSVDHDVPPEAVQTALPTVLRAVTAWLPHSDSADEFRYRVAHAGSVARPRHEDRTAGATLTLNT
jgi:hypothetical protein